MKQSEHDAHTDMLIAAEARQRARWVYKPGPRRTFWKWFVHRVLLVAFVLAMYTLVDALWN